ncbi:ABC transporter ATP-binding protein [Luteimonas terrae]|uniref:ABC-2 type transport system ATP-binding protein n=1 Tax=Luteimonas terrae TaxID=1530191 RepID=A0ABU1XYY4_9GAMM|nr:ABC transporter ATP-binding protein [Luteimonas terrae]MDR7193415.1 ABC-2 type transport system ATP-binding protein [Luteimonas terrae]
MALNATPLAPLARLTGVRRRRGAVQALDGVDLALPAGQVTALLGVNGAGKTTAIEVLLGLQPADSGEVTLLDRPPSDLDARRLIGVMLQQAQLPERLQVGELLALTRSWYPQPRSVADCVALAGLDGLLDRRYGRLSGGQQRRVQFALALCGRPKLLFLDEPTTGLDIGARQQVWRAIRSLVADGVGILLTTHYLEEAEALADRVVVLDAGRVRADGSVGDVRAQVAQRRICCTSVVPAEVVASWPGVRTAKRIDGQLVVMAEHAESVLRRLLDADPQLGDLEVQRAGLAEAFVAMTAPAEPMSDSKQEAA